MTPFQNPTIYIGSLRVDEPITTVTDLLFIGVCVYAFFKTAHLSSYRSVNLYRWFFLLTGLSTLVAALMGHAFLYYFGAQAKIYGWIFGIISISFSQFAALYHTRQMIPVKTFKLLLLLFGIETLVAFVLTFVFWTFIVVEIHTAFCLLLVCTTLETMYYKKTKSTLSLFMIYGVVALVVAVLCHVLKIAFSVWFNHADLSHIFMAISMYLMYKGVNSYNEKQELELI
jgi:hypothetical protein